MPEPNICDECLSGVWALEDEELLKHASECWPDGEKLPVGSIVQYIDQYKAHWPSAEEAIKQREQMRKAFG